MNKPIRITGVYDSVNLAKAIRVNNILEEIGKYEDFDVKLVNSNTITDEIASSSDVVYYNWSIGNPSWELSVLKAKYPDLKIVMDVDDSSNYSLLHPLYRDVNKRLKSQQIQNSQAFEVDGITVSTLPLRDTFSQFNPNVTVVENFLPIGEGQYKSNKKSSDKLRIGIYGTISSHYADYLQLKPIINRLAKCKEIVDNCEWYILGYRPSAYWDEIINFFKVKKNITLHIREAKPITEYMELLQEIDICLIPLEEIPYNEAKSALKILECSIAGVIPIGSKLYETKEISGILVCDTPLSYENTIKYLLNKENYNKTLEKIQEVNFRDNDWNGRIEKLKNVFKSVKRADNSPENVKIWGITYSPEQVTEYTQFDNSKRNKNQQYFEYNVILDLEEDIKKLEKDTRVGVLSWKFPQKTNISSKLLYTMMQGKDINNYDVINLTPYYNGLDGKYLSWSDSYHPMFLDKFTKMCEYLGLEVIEPEHVIFSNMHLCKRDTYLEFIELVKKALKVLEKHEDVIGATENAKYTVGISPEELEQRTGVGFYQYFTFLLERLFSVYLQQNKQIKVKDLLR